MTAANLETGVVRNDDHYDTKIPTKPHDKAAGEKIVKALRVWAKRHDASAD